MSRKCSRDSCHKVAHRGGLCRVHRLSGGYVDAKECVAYVKELRAHGYSLRKISEESGLDRETVRNLGRWTNKGNVEWATHVRIMRIPLPVKIVDAGGKVPNVGTKRRIQALMAWGYSLDHLAEELGVTPQCVSWWLRVDNVSSETLVKVRGVFDRLQLKQGPSKRAMNAAARKNWAPPFAWDQDDMDNPDSQPIIGENGSFEDFVKEARELNYTDEKMAGVLNIQVESLKQRIRRAKIA